MYHLVGIEDYVNFTTLTPAPNTKIKFASASKLASTTYRCREGHGQPSPVNLGLPSLFWQPGSYRYMVIGLSQGNIDILLRNTSIAVS